MSNANKQKYPGKRQKRRNSSTAMGIGLILFGVAFFLWLLGSSGKASLPTADEISIVPAEVNFPAPQLALENLNGEKQTLEDYQGRIVLVNNWATWCPPCKAEMPILKQYHDTHAA